MNRSGGVVHALASCEDCGWNAQGYKNAQAIGAKHAKGYKHRVSVDVALSFVYDGREERPIPRNKRP